MKLHNRLHLLATAGLCLLVQSASAGGWLGQKPLTRKSSPFTHAYEKLVNRTLQEWHVPGISIAVVDGDDTWAEGYGIASFPSTAVTPSTLFYGASTSKAFTAAILALMIESGNYSTDAAPALSASSSPGRVPLDWRTSLSAILGDDFVLSDAWATAHLTLEDALSHRTGLPRHDHALSRVYGGGEDRHAATLRDVVRSLRYLPLTQEPRTMFQYCNLMYAVASHVAETLAGGRWLGDLLHEWIWEPLGMRATFFSLSDAEAAPEHFASGYAWEEERAEYRRVPFMPLEEISGAGAVVSNVLDYAKWLRFLINEEAPLSKEGHAAIKTPKSIFTTEAGPFDTPTVYASGWFATSYKGHRVFFHSGGMHAYGAEVYIFPDDKYGIVMFGNTAGTSNAAELVLLWHLVDEKLGVPEDKRHDWGKDFREVLDRIDQRVDSAVETLYPDVKDGEAIPPALPLEKYAGTYFNPGYQNITLGLSGPGETGVAAEKRLMGDQLDSSWPSRIGCRHVSGEFWVAYIDYLHAPGSPVMKEYAAAQFRLTPGGEVSQLGIQWRDVATETVYGWIWYDKLE